MSGFTYLILSHRDPDQVERLVRAIRHLSPDARVVITHDCHASEPPRPLDALVEVHRRRHGNAWGRFDLVDAVLERLAGIAEQDGDWVAVISGQDFPARDLEAWEADVRTSGANAVIRHLRIADRMSWGRRRNGWGQVLARYEHRQFRLPPPRRQRGPLAKKVRWGLQWTISNLGPIVSFVPTPDGGTAIGIRRLRSPFSPGFPCRKGSQWLALDRAATRHLLQADRSSGLRQVYENSLIPDESYIQTILGNASHLRVEDRAVTADLFIPSSNPHPERITCESLPRLLAVADETGAGFVRKVDQETAIEAIEELERRLGIPW